MIEFGEGIEMSRSGWRQLAMLVMCLMIWIMSWEGQKVDAAVPGWIQQSDAIPQASIRLRILANSDQPSDQLLKLQIRDAVVQEMNTWVSELDQPQSLQEARRMVRSRLPEIEATVGEQLALRNVNYKYNVELGNVPFPNKWYGNRLYPAGDYEAVRITLGSGQGQNWWCVLFPPLCFVGAATGDGNTAAAAAAVGDDTSPVTAGEEPEVRFFLWDMLVKGWNWLSSLFA